MASGILASPAIKIRALSKRFGRLMAVKGLNLEVEPGEIFGFLGLNGADRATTIRMLLDLPRPSLGSASILGFECIWAADLHRP